MFDYGPLRKSHGSMVSQTIDSPIMIFDYFELSDGFAALLTVLVFGVVFYAWDVMFVLLLGILGLAPYIRRRNNRGIFLHWPYRRLGIQLPGLINPGQSKSYSD